MEVEKAKKHVIVYTPLHRIEGDIHIPAGLRLIDALNAAGKPFFAMTDVKIYPPNGEEPLLETPFLAISKENIIAIISD